MTALSWALDFSAFVIVAFILLSLVPKTGPKFYRALASVFYIGWAVVLEELSGMIFAIYTMQGLLILERLATVSPESVRVFGMTIIFIPVLILINVVLYAIHRLIKAREAANV